MIIPRPEFRPVVVDYSGLGFFAKVKKLWRARPSFALTADWIITLDDGLEIIFPDGFVTDFASVPRMFWLIPGFSPFGILLEGSIAHDFGYQHGYLLTPFDSVRSYPARSLKFYCANKDAFGENIPVYIGYDQPFFDNLMAGICTQVTGATVVPWIAKTVLGLFGHIAWNRYRKHGPGAYGVNSLLLPEKEM